MCSGDLGIAEMAQQGHLVTALKDNTEGFQATSEMETTNSICPGFSQGAWRGDLTLVVCPSSWQMAPAALKC